MDTQPQTMIKGYPVDTELLYRTQCSKKNITRFLTYLKEHQIPLEEAYQYIGKYTNKIHYTSNSNEGRIRKYLGQYYHRYNIKNEYSTTGLITPEMQHQILNKEKIIK